MFILIIISLLSVQSLAEAKNPSVNLTVDGDSLVGTHCPGTVTLTCKGVDLSALRWTYDPGQNTLVTFFPDNIPPMSSSSYPIFPSVSLSDISRDREDPDVANYSSVLTVDLEQLQLGGITRISCGDGIRNDGETVNVSINRQESPDPPDIINVTAIYQSNSLSSLQIVWGIMAPACPDYEKSLFYEVGLVNTGSSNTIFVRVNHTDCMDSLTCSAKIRNPTKGNGQYSISLRALNEINSSRLTQYPFPIEYLSLNYLSPELSLSGCQPTGRCGNTSGAVCTIEYGTDPSYSNPIAVIMSPRDETFSISGLESNKKYYFTFKVEVNTSLLIVEQLEAVSATITCQDNSATFQWAIPTLVSLEVIFLVLLLMFVVVTVTKRKSTFKNYRIPITCGVMFVLSILLIVAFGFVLGLTDGNQVLQTGLTCVFIIFLLICFAVLLVITYYARSKNKEDNTSLLNDSIQKDKSSDQQNPNGTEKKDGSTQYKESSVNLFRSNQNTKQSSSSLANSTTVNTKSEPESKPKSKTISSAPTGAHPPKVERNAQKSLKRTEDGTSDSQNLNAEELASSDKETGPHKKVSTADSSSAPEIHQPGFVESVLNVVNVVKTKLFSASTDAQGPESQEKGSDQRNPNGTEKKDGSTQYDGSSVDLSKKKAASNQNTESNKKKNATVNTASEPKVMQDKMTSSARIGAHHSQVEKSDQETDESTKTSEQLSTEGQSSFDQSTGSHEKGSTEDTSSAPETRQPGFVEGFLNSLKTTLFSAPAGAQGLEVKSSNQQTPSGTDKEESSVDLKSLAASSQNTQPNEQFEPKPRLMSSKTTPSAPTGAHPANQVEKTNPEGTDSNPAQFEFISVEELNQGTGPTKN